MASESDSSSSSPSESPNSPPPPSSSPPPPTDKDSGSDSDNRQSPPPPPSDKGSDSDSPSSSPPPPPPPPSNGNSNSPTPPPPPRQSGQVFSPPPPPHKLSLPGHRSSSGSSDSSRGSSSSGSNSNSNKGTQLSVPVIIGIAGGAGLLLLVIILLFISCRRRRRRSESPIHYYEKPAKTDGDYFKHPNNEFNQGVYVVSIPPPPGGAPKVWAPSPPTGQFNSSESTSSNSGPYGPALPPPHPSVALGFNKSTFTYEELSIATGGFANENLLGQGGFGYVHKGVLPNGKSIAVKSLKSTGGQGDREFQAEVDIISRVHHRHLVSLVGYCISEGTKILIYEFVPNKTLEYHLHGKDRPVMPWNIRLKIAIGSAKGLAYLHEDCHPRIIHRDIKGANILIEDNFEAKVADFGLAKFTQDNNTHVSTRVMGTFGYLAPEYASSGKLTEKSDVFSYGVMLLELITGRRPIDTTGEYEDESLVDWARPLCTSAMENGKYEELVDSRLGNNYERNELACMVTCAAACVRHSARRRPKMSQIVRALEGDVSLDDLGEGVKAGGQNSVYSAEYNTGAYNADMEKFRKLALDSGSGSSESRQTGEYGLNLSISK